MTSSWNSMSIFTLLQCGRAFMVMVAALELSYIGSQHMITIYSICRHSYVSLAIHVNKWCWTMSPMSPKTRSRFCDVSFNAAPLKFMSWGMCPSLQNTFLQRHWLWWIRNNRVRNSNHRWMSSFYWLNCPSDYCPRRGWPWFICDGRIHDGSHMQLGMRPDDPIGQHWLPLRYDIITCFTIWNVWHINSAKIDLPLIVIIIF